MEPRKADVAVTYNGKNATVKLAPLLASFTYTDVASGSSDSISMELNDRDHKWIGSWFPKKGDKIKPTIQTHNWDKDGVTEKLSCGTYTIDNFSIRGGPIRLTMDGLAIPSTSGFKATDRSHTYKKTTLKAIGKKVAARAGLKLHYEAKTINIEKVEQDNQPDCTFYSDLVSRYGLAMKLYSNKLVVFDEAKYEGKKVVATLSPKDFDPNWSWNTSLTGTYTGVNYKYTNGDKKKTYTVIAGTPGKGKGKRILKCSEPAQNLGEAVTIALAALNNANKGATTMSITIRSNRKIIATSCVQIKDLGKLNGKYYVEEVVHSLGDSGYKMKLSLRKVEKRITSVKMKKQS